jgi:hypothetical protein
MALGQSGKDTEGVLPSAAALMQIATGFWASKVLAAAVELELFRPGPYP